jgi:hypothetical protein
MECGSDGNDGCLSLDAAVAPGERSLSAVWSRAVGSYVRATIDGDGQQPLRNMDNRETRSKKLNVAMSIAQITALQNAHQTEAHRGA